MSLLRNRGAPSGPFWVATTSCCTLSTLRKLSGPPFCVVITGVAYPVDAAPAAATTLGPAGPPPPPPPPPPLPPTPVSLRSLPTSAGPPRRSALTNPSASPSTPMGAYTVLRAMLTPPHETDSGVWLPSSSGRLVSSTPLRASNASRKPEKSTEYTTPLATETGGPQCAPSAIGPTQR